MEIKIPKSKIFDYSYNVLRDNYINKLYINEQDAYNFLPIHFEIQTGVVGDYDVTTSSNVVLEIKDINEQDMVTDEYNNTYYVNYGYIQLPSTEYYNYGTLLNDINSIKTSFYYDITSIFVNLELEVSISKEYREVQITVGENKCGQIIFNPDISSDGKLYFKIAYIFLYNDNLVNQSEYDIYLNYSLVENTYIYQLSEDSNDKYSLQSNSFFDKLNRDKTSSQTIFEYIASDIAKDYEFGIMELQLETRVGIFNYEDGTLVNNGEPYLIKVGDIIKPEFPNRLSMYEKTFMVTSVEYSYDGIDKVIIKSVEYKEREN